MLHRLAQSLRVLLLILIPCSVVSAAPVSFEEAKRLAERVYADHPRSFYCGCRIQWNRSGGDKPDLSSCGYKVRKSAKRASWIEWEHVVPASVLGRQRQCWKDGGRRNCKAVDPVFREMEGNLHNLVPAVGEVNSDRSDFAFGVIPGEPSRYGACPIEIDFKAEVAEPADQVKGDIARIYFYMADRYKLRLSRQQQQLFMAWDRLDPVDAWEQTRDQRIRQFMGHPNPFVTGERQWRLNHAVTSPPPQDIQRSDAKPVTTPPADATAIRGNKNSKVYHRPDCPSYGAVSPRNRVEFASAAEAERAGYRQAGNCPSR